MIFDESLHILRYETDCTSGKIPGMGFVIRSRITYLSGRQREQFSLRDPLGAQDVVGHQQFPAEGGVQCSHHLVEGDSGGTPPLFLWQ